MISSAPRSSATSRCSAVRSESGGATASSSMNGPSCSTSSRWIRTFRHSSRRRRLTTTPRMPIVAASAAHNASPSLTSMIRYRLSRCCGSSARSNWMRCGRPGPLQEVNAGLGNRHPVVPVIRAGCEVVGVEAEKEVCAGGDMAVKPLIVELANRVEAVEMCALRGVVGPP